MSGHGEYTSPDGAKYVGEFKEGKMSGQGECTFPDGGKYVGEWKEGKNWGQGTLTHRNGNVYSGEWENGEPVPGKFTRNDQPWHGSGKDALAGI